MMAANTPTYAEAEKEFLGSVDKVLDSVGKKISSLSITEKLFGDSTKTLKLENNTIHVYNGKDGVKNLTITYPDENFVSTVLFSTAKSGKISVSFPPKTTKFAGSASYEFFPAENWELNIHNGRVVGVQLFDD